MHVPVSLDETTKSPLLDALERASSGNARWLLLNMADVKAMDSFGLGQMMSVVTLAGRRGMRVLACCLNPAIARIFALSRLDESIAIYPGEQEARQAVARGDMPRTVTPPDQPSQATTPRAPYDDRWAPPVERLHVSGLAKKANNLNVEGRRVLSPLNGFGRMIFKTYRIRLVGATLTPAELISAWRANFASFWPKGNRYVGPHEVISAGDTAVLNLTLLGPLKLNTGIYVIYAGDTSFCFITPQGHMFGGLITFSAYTDGGVTVARVQPLIRASDPFYEMTLRLGIGGAIEDRFWKQSLRNLAAFAGASGAAEMQTEVIDRGVQWANVRNIWYNAAIRTTFYTLAAPLRWLRRQVGR